MIFLMLLIASYVGTYYGYKYAHHNDKSKDWTPFPPIAWVAAFIPLMNICMALVITYDIRRNNNPRDRKDWDNKIFGEKKK